MAAKLHMQQVHNGDGTIELGAGPGVESVSTPAVAAPAGPPTAPIARDNIDERRRERPTPRPLHQSNYEVPPAAMEAMLGVWDTIGTKRSIEGFVHSSMVLKVYAAKPSGPEAAYVNMMPTPSCPNPFADFERGVRRTWKNPAPPKQCPPSPFQVALGSVQSADECAWIANPYASRSVVPKAETTKPVKQEDPTEAPVTPFGQLPKFGQAIPTQATQTVTPFGAPPGTAAPSNPYAAAAQAASPFAAAAQAASPFAAAAQAASPFAAAAQAASPFAAAAQAAIPFAAAAQAASPFAAAAQAASPFAAAAQPSPFPVGTSTPQSPFASPFSSSGSAPSPFTGAASPSPFATSPFEASPFGSSASPFPAFPGFEAFGMGLGTFATSDSGKTVSPADEKKFTCSTCSKAFHTEFGLAMHSKQKHNIDIPLVVKDHKRKERVPDLPAYVPSPVDLAGTSPFGAEHTVVAQRWGDVEVVPHALSVNNITIVGIVSEIDSNARAAEGTLSTAFATVRVASDEASDGFDDFVVQCDANSLLGLSKGDTVCVVGSIRLHPTLDDSSGKYYSVPILHVSEGSGALVSL